MDKHEEALRAIVKAIEEAGPTTTHDVRGDRQRANRALYEAIRIARNALEEPK